MQKQDVDPQTQVCNVHYFCMIKAQIYLCKELPFTTPFRPEADQEVLHFIYFNK